MPELKELYQRFLENPVVSTDTRKIMPGSIYFALKGASFDGNAFAADAIKLGASLAVIDDPAFEIPGKTWLVQEVLPTLQELASYHRKKLKTTIIGITGTNGKTTTKELILAVLSQKYKVLATEGNLNNHIGVPLTLLRLKPEHEFGIIEMGANHIGEIAELSAMAQPDFGLITNIGKAHLKGFGSYEGVKKAKTELYAQIRKTHGTVFVNEADPVLLAASEGIDRILYGLQLAAPVTLKGGRVGLQLREGGQIFKSQLFGNYNYINMLVAVTVGLHFKVATSEIAKALEEYQPTNNRSQIIETGKNTIIMDAYNANPSSMEPALRSFASIEGKKLVILGDMFELGDVAEEEHQKLVNLLSELKLKESLLVGEEFSKVANNFKSFKTTEDCRSFLKQLSPQGYHILLKGSRGMQLEKIREDIP